MTSPSYFSPLVLVPGIWLVGHSESPCSPHEGPSVHPPQTKATPGGDAWLRPNQSSAPYCLGGTGQASFSPWRWRGKRRRRGRRERRGQQSKQQSASLCSGPGLPFGCWGDNESHVCFIIFYFRRKHNVIITLSSLPGASLLSPWRPAWAHPTSDTTTVVWWWRGDAGADDICGGSSGGFWVGLVIMMACVCHVNLQDVCTYLSPAASPPQTLGTVGIGSSSPRDQPLHPAFPSPRKQPHHPSFSAPEGPATLSCHLPPYMNTEHAQSWPSINVSREKNDENYIRQLIDSPAVLVGGPTQCSSQKRMHGEKKERWHNAEKT